MTYRSNQLGDAMHEDNAKGRPVSWVYSVAFKKRKGGKLRWLISTKQDVAEASKEAKGQLPKAWREYGASVTYLRQWETWTEVITQEQYLNGMASPLT